VHACCKHLPVCIRVTGWSVVDHESACTAIRHSHSNMPPPAHRRMRACVLQTSSSLHRSDRLVRLRSRVCMHRNKAQPLQHAAACTQTHACCKRLPIGIELTSACTARRLRHSLVWACRPLHADVCVCVLQTTSSL